MKYKNKVQQAREKFLKRKPLSPKEQAIIDKDFRGKDYAYFQLLNEDDLLLPEQFSAEATFSKIEQRFGTRQNRYPLLKYAAAVVLLVCSSISLFYITNYPKMIIVSTSFGEKKEVCLPDGSNVILNSLSSVSYPKKMNGDVREVMLEGEAFFDVVKDVRKTFIVKAQEIEVNVLGTQFNVSAYPDDENIITSLYEGAVAITLGSGETFRLQPGEQAIYSKSFKSVEIESFEEEGQRWIGCSLCFSRKPLKEIWKTLEREMNIVFEVSDEVDNELRITANFSRDDSMDDILNILGQAGNFTFSRIDNLYIINAE